MPRKKPTLARQKEKEWPKKSHGLGLSAPSPAHRSRCIETDWQQPKKQRPALEDLHGIGEEHDG